MKSFHNLSKHSCWPLPHHVDNHSLNFGNSTKEYWKTLINENNPSGTVNTKSVALLLRLHPSKLIEGERYCAKWISYTQNTDPFAKFVRVKDHINVDVWNAFWGVHLQFTMRLSDLYLGQCTFNEQCTFQFNINNKHFRLAFQKFFDFWMINSSSWCNGDIFKSD